MQGECQKGRHGPKAAMTLNISYISVAYLDLYIALFVSR
jgi:hypothetical protein